MSEVATVAGSLNSQDKLMKSREEVEKEHTADASIQ